jgi:hypothetical protein
VSSTITAPVGAPPISADWDPELDGPAWLADPKLAEKILADMRREHIFRLLTGYYEDRGAAHAALRKIDPDCPRREWIRIGMALKHEFGEEGWFLWQSWSSRGEKYDPSTIRSQWDSFRKHPNPVTLGTILHLAKAEVARG